MFDTYADLHEMERALLGHIKAKSLDIRHGTCIDWATGERAEMPLEFDLNKTLLSPHAALVGEILYERTKDLAIDALGGAAEAIPLVVATVIAYHHHERTMEGFFVRERKDHGTGQSVEGHVKPGMKVAVVDATFSTGQDAIKTVETLATSGYEVASFIALVDRMGLATPLMNAHGIATVQVVFSWSDLETPGWPSREEWRPQRMEEQMVWP